MNRHPKVSVCVPTYNRAHYLSSCLDSIFGQTFSDFEVIVADNASTDGTPKMAAGFSDPRLRYVRNPSNLGQIPNINRALSFCTGDYVSICHDDDVYAPDMLQRQVEVMTEHPNVSLVHTAVWMMSETGEIRRLHRVSKDNYIVKGTEAFFRYLAHSHDIVFSTVMVRKTCYEAVGSFDSAFLCADFEMWLKLALQGDIAYLAEPLAGYRVHSASASSSMNANKWFGEYFEIFNRAITEAHTKRPELSIPVETLRAQAYRSQARRSRIEAAACIAAANYAAAVQYIEAASRMDPSWKGQCADWLLRLGADSLGGAVLRFVREARRRYALWAIRRRVASTGNLLQAFSSVGHKV